MLKSSWVNIVASIRVVLLLLLLVRLRYRVSR